MSTILDFDKVISVETYYVNEFGHRSSRAPKQPTQQGMSIEPERVALFKLKTDTWTFCVRFALYANRDFIFTGARGKREFGNYMKYKYGKRPKRRERKQLKLAL